jgi:aspartate/methionine/tyrosine aminotransferase
MDVITMNVDYVERRLASMRDRSHQQVVVRARQMDGVINLGGGDPDFDTPQHIVDSMINAVKEGMTHYPSPQGLPALRNAIAEYHQKHGVDWRATDVLVTAGSGISLFASMTGMVNPKEEVILLEPYFMAYSDIVEYYGAKEIGVALNEEKGFRLDEESLNEAVTEKTKMIVLCNPNNPSGTVYSEKELNTSRYCQG